MTDTTASPQAAATTAASSRTPPLFVVTVFTSAALVFMVQPMVGKLVLPLLGGSPAVWNTSMAFFQFALLIGYGYAHFLQKLGSVKRQITVHIAALAIAALVLPLRVTGLLGEPSSTSPILWLLGVLALSIGLPFAILSATAPLVQAWHAKVVKGEGASEPYALYAASNLGSLLALLAYPIILEPLLTLQAQRWTWTSGYVGFVLILAALALLVWRNANASAQTPQVIETAPATPAPSLLTRLIWIGLAAIPSSLMLGVTTYLATDVASAPFMWVVPLALYLVTFIIAFQPRPLISPYAALLLQGAVLPLTIFLTPQQGVQLPIMLGAHLLCFFLSALVCHQALVERRPDPSHLTIFYLCLSIGGVVGGAFNAFVAPGLFNTVLEYPLVLVLAGLARPWNWGKMTPWEIGVLVAGILGAVAASFMLDHFAGFLTFDALLTLKTLLGVTIISAFLLRGRGLVFTGLLVALSIGAHVLGDRADIISTQRSFFGVLQQTRYPEPRLGEIRLLSHGTTLHGAQATDPRWACKPLVYYAHETPIGQVFVDAQARRQALRIGAVGLGTGSVAAYVRPGDHLTFFEIDPLVIDIAHRSGDFTYTTKCAKGPVDFVLGDARLTLEKQPAEAFDVLLIDAFSSDAIPAHLLTVEAVRGYLSKLKPDGVLVLHLSNRHLELIRPALAVAKAAGGTALVQWHSADRKKPHYWESSENVVVVGRSPEAIQQFADDARWTRTTAMGVKPWTDDYTNLIGALIRAADQKRWGEEP
jgi:SAM-dependent methyltransferase